VPSAAARSAQLRREAEMRALSEQSQNRITRNQQREQMKKLMRSVANEREELPISDLLLTAELANVPLSDAQKQLLFTTPYANAYASTWEPNSPRSQYGLECTPRSVKWRQFHAALEHSRLQTADGVDAALRHYASKEARMIADAKRRDDEAKELARSRAEATGKPTESMKGISDDQLRMVHKIVKSRLSTQFNDLRSTFLAFDRDHSGNISASECTDALMSLNVGVPRKWIDHLVNIADYDRDGEINYSEFARILTCDDIVSIKKAGAEEEGLVVKKDAFWKPGITMAEMKSAQSKINDMLHERGGMTKMFRQIDEDKSGFCSRQELRQLIFNLNLSTVIRPAVIEELIGLMDEDGSDNISFGEFARVVSSDDVLHMSDDLTKGDHMPPPKKPPPKKLTKREKRLQMKRDLGMA